MKIEKLHPSDKSLIDQISQWYLNEWNIPIDRTTERLTRQSEAGILFHLVLKKENQVIATGGLYTKVGLLIEHPQYQKFQPWVALLYTDKEYRNKGIGKILLNKIEEESKKIGYKKIYLFTSTAESLYKREGWIVIDTVMYRGNENVVMEKEI